VSKCENPDSLENPEGRGSGLVAKKEVIHEKNLSKVTTLLTTCLFLWFKFKFLKLLLRGTEL